jgi:hypothetical protein
VIRSEPRCDGPVRCCKRGAKNRPVQVGDLPHSAASTVCNLVAPAVSDPRGSMREEGKAVDTRLDRVGYCPICPISFPSPGRQELPAWAAALGPWLSGRCSVCGFYGNVPYRRVVWTSFSFLAVEFPEGSIEARKLLCQRCAGFRRLPNSSTARRVRVSAIQEAAWTGSSSPRVRRSAPALRMRGQPAPIGFPIG